MMRTQAQEAGKTNDRPTDLHPAVLQQETG